MQRFKSIIYKMQGKSKTNLQWLYNDVYNPNHEEPEKIFIQGDLKANKFL